MSHPRRPFTLTLIVLAVLSLMAACSSPNTDDHPDGHYYTTFTFEGDEGPGFYANVDIVPDPTDPTTYSGSGGIRDRCRDEAFYSYISDSSYADGVSTLTISYENLSFAITFTIDRDGDGPWAFAETPDHVLGASHTTRTGDAGADVPDRQPDPANHPGC